MSEGVFLNARLHGEGYDEELILSFKGSQILCRYWTYGVVENAAGEPQLNLNFGGQGFLPHAIKRLANMFVLIPRFYDVGSERYPSRGMYLDPAAYLDVSLQQIFIFPQEDLIDLWKMLRLPLDKLTEITEVRSQDLLLLWLLSSGFKPIYESFSPIDAYGKELIANIIAEHPDCNPPVKHIIRHLLDEELIFDTSRVLHIKNMAASIVYILEQDNALREWHAVVASNSFICIITDTLGVYLIHKESVSQ